MEDLQPMKRRNFGYCGECRIEDIRIIEQKERFMKMNSKLIGMELFSGKNALPTNLSPHQIALRCWWTGSWNEPLQFC